jgi:CBS domain-containing protein
MADIDAGAIPVQENDRLVGMITDRDIAVRAVAAGKGPDTPVRDVMSKDIKYCYEDEELDHVAKNMADIRVRRLPVVNRDKRLVGIISLGDVAVKEEQPAAKAVAGVSRPGGPHAT